MSIRVLDCTLRDGGYINDWRFGRKTIMSILDKLDQAHIDIVECGFLTRMVQEKECSLFNSTAEIEEVLPNRKRNSMYVAMVAIGEKELHPSQLDPYDGKGIQGIRLTFHKNEVEQAFEWARIIMEKGYHVFMQPVGTVFYSDIELLQLVEKINALHPYAFYIVDTLGSMYRNEVSHRFYIIDENMAPEIQLGFHGHNNMQLAFSNAQVLGKIQTIRTLILDSAVYGMGRGAGNLPTELITQYINKKIDVRYDVTTVMDIYDEYIAPIRKDFEWGYTMPYHIAASNVCHPNYATYLINRQTLTMKDIETIIQSIPKEYKILYDQDLIERLYTQFQSRKIDDCAAIQEISVRIRDKKILLLAPGKSLSSQYHQILEFIDKEKPYVISVNFIDLKYHMDACFISNHKRMDIIERDIKPLNQTLVIVTSNIPKTEKNNYLYVDYNNYLIPDDLISDNAGLMLLQLLKRCEAAEVFLAGFDGFHYGQRENYYSDDLNFPVYKDHIYEKRKRIRKQLSEFAQTMKITFFDAVCIPRGKLMYRCVLFDMDGTLIDSYTGIFHAYQWAVQQSGIGFPGDALVRQAIGAPLPYAFETLCGMDSDTTKQAVQQYREYYARKGWHEVSVYPGIEAALKQLKRLGCFIGTATLKREHFAKRILKEQGLISYFDLVSGMDENDTLTKVDLIRCCMRTAKVSRKETILVGDSMFDAASAQEAGVAFLAVTYGFGFQDRQEWEAENVHLVAQTAQDIVRQILAVQD
ncbi:MAG: HAD hydrolase-like protein [Acutalibacteraceae bacterium]